MSGARSNTVNISNVVRHFKMEHGGDLASFSFMGIDKIYLGPRGGDKHKLLLSRETRWIFELESRVPLGLNNRWDVSLCTNG